MPKQTTKKGGWLFHFHIVTLFPESFDSYLGESIIARAIKENKIKVSFYNPRDFVKPKNKWVRQVDGRPYGGGPGMVMQAEPVIKAIAKAQGRKNIPIIFFSPGGKQFTNSVAENLSIKNSNIIMVCGRYEGIDARIKKVFKMTNVSVGPYVLTGGELPAMIVIDSVSRQISGVLGNTKSLEENRISSHDVYTRPEVFTYKKKSYRVPKVLLSGNHAKIDAWKQKKGGLSPKSRKIA